MTPSPGSGAGEPAREREEPVRVRLGGLHTAVIGGAALAELMVTDCLLAREAAGSVDPVVVFSSNGQGIALAADDPEFAAAMAAADIIHADGQSVVHASRLTAHPLPERVATTDFFHNAARAATAHGLRFFLLGASEEQNRAAAEAIARDYPHLEVVGRQHGYFDADEDEEICRRIVESGADVLWVALGKPRQELWSIRNRERLRGVGWVKTCGGLYAFLAGDSPRAPRWMQRVGLEWLYRAFDDPKRLAWRYITTNPRAAWLLLRDTDRGRRASGQ
jgi:exopolysaccharide biosynthesis WecB/TagA/CpsF family protein